MVGLLFTMITGPAMAASREQLQLQQLEARIREVQAQIQNTRTEYGILQRQLQDKEEKIGEVAERLEKLHGELSDKKNTLMDLETRQKNQVRLLEKQRQLLTKQIRAAYIVGQQNYLKLLLNQENPATIGRVLTYHDYFNQARLRQITATQTSLEHLQKLKQQIQEENRTLNQLGTSKTDKEHQFAASRVEREKILVQLATLLESQDKELKRLQEDKHQLQMLLGTLEDALKDTPQSGQFLELKGQLPYPLKGQTLKQFGEHLVNGLTWQGILIAAPPGTHVKAIASGRVVFAEWFRNLGLLVIVDHGKGYMSLYAHNQSLYTKTGDWVAAGETIASVGNSGGHTTPALYFEIRQQGIPINPQKWLSHLK